MQNRWNRLFENGGRNGSLVLPATCTTAAAAVAIVVLWGIRGSSTTSKGNGDEAGWVQAITQPFSALYSKVYVAMLQIRPGGNDSPDTHTIVTDLVYYPVKSLQRVAVDAATMGPRGLQHDRGMMLVVPTGATSSGKATHRFVSQRRYPTLARIQASVVNDETDGEAITHRHHNKQHWVVRLHDTTTRTSCTVPLVPPEDAPVYTARVWSQTVQVQDMGDAAAQWLQQSVARDAEFVDTDPPVRLVRQLPSDQRRANRTVVPFVAHTLFGQTPRVSLADGFPLLMTSQASLDDINQRLIAKGKDALPMTRFRPNLVIQGHTAWAEDRMKVIRVGSNTIFYVINGCPRCQQSCTDQDTGEVTDEPAATLGDYRTMVASSQDVYFGVNLVAAPGSQGATIRVGDPVTVLAWGTPAWSEG